MYQLTTAELQQFLDDLQIRTFLNDIDNLHSNIKLLSEKGLTKLNERLLNETRRLNFLSTLTEHNFTANLLKTKIDIKNEQVIYEPNYEGQNRPPDLHIIYGGINYWIQIKRLSPLKKDNIRDKLFDRIENAVKSIRVNKFLNLNISTDFSDEDIQPLVNAIEKVSASKEDKTYNYNSGASLKAEFSFINPNQLKLNYLSFGIFGTLGAEWIIGLTREQIVSSLTNAVGAFYNDTDSKHINLIVIELDQPPHDAIDIGEALYGSEYFTFNQGSSTAHRDVDGLFRQEFFSKKIAGVVVLKRKNSLLIDDYWQVICISPVLEELAEKVTVLIRAHKEIRQHTWIGKGFFDLDF